MFIAKIRQVLTALLLFGAKKKVIYTALERKTPRKRTGLDSVRNPHVKVSNTLVVRVLFGTPIRSIKYHVKRIHNFPLQVRKKKSIGRQRPIVTAVLKIKEKFNIWTIISGAISLSDRRVTCGLLAPLALF